MGMFDDVVINAKAAANAIQKKAGNICDISKLKFNASSIKGEINKKYQIVGETLYKSKYSSPVAQEEIDKQLEEIKALNDDLSAVMELIATAKNLMICPECGSVIANDSLYCCKCGKKVEKAPEQATTEEETVTETVETVTETAQDVNSATSDTVE